MENTIVLAPQEVIDQYEKTAIEFFKKILKMDYLDCLVTDESYLSDFSFCGMPEDLLKAELDSDDDIDNLNLKWGEYILQKIEEVYGLKIETQYQPLITVFSNIEKNGTVLSNKKKLN